MIVTIVEIKVKEEFLEPFIEITRYNHKHSVEEEGNLRFDILQHIDDPKRFTLYEAYKNEESAAAHKKTRHYLKWKDMVAEWMAKPRKGIRHRVIEPNSVSQW